MIETTIIPTPMGPIGLAARGDTLVAAGFTSVADLLARLGNPDSRALADLGGLSKAVGNYLDGDLGALDAIPVDQPGTPFPRAVWAALRALPAGTTGTYGALATAVGNPTAVRAVGSACGRNLVAPVVPCHRAVGAGGALGGYYYGLSVKRWLLAHEAGAATL